MDRIELRLDGLNERLHAVETSLSSVSDRLDVIVGKLPGWWQSPLSAAGLFTLMVALIAVAKALHLLT